jgi:hypothetical protein
MSDLVMELVSAMEVVNIPDDGDSSPLINERARTVDMSDLPTNLSNENQPTSRIELQAPPPRPPPPPLPQQATNNRRPFDDLIAAGPPTKPIDFPPPRFERGRRDNVLCYDPPSDKHFEAKNVLFRDFSREFPDDGDARVSQAYWPLPHKEHIKTIMGHVEICLILTRCVRQSGDTDDDDDESYDEEEDIVFQVTGQYVAVKVNYCARMDQLRGRHSEDPLTEIAAMQLIGEEHPNVLGCRDVLFDGQNLNVVMRYCQGGDMFELLQNSIRDGDNPGMTEGHGRYWFRQVIAGIQYLHSVGICHRDLSPENIMVDNNGCLIIDMGMCLRVPYTDPRSPGAVTDISQGTQRRLFAPQGTCGKLPYMSPEIHRNRRPFDGGAVDVWTAGTILFCMLTGNRSYQQPHPSDPQFYWMTRGLTQMLSDWDVKLSPEGVHLLQNMLQVDPRLRLTIEEVVNHPWFDHPDDPA